MILTETITFSREKQNQWTSRLLLKKVVYPVMNLSNAQLVQQPRTVCTCDSSIYKHSKWTYKQSNLLDSILLSSFILEYNFLLSWDIILFHELNKNLESAYKYLGMLGHWQLDSAFQEMLRYIIVFCFVCTLSFTTIF